MNSAHLLSILIGTYLATAFSISPKSESIQFRSVVRECNGSGDRIADSMNMTIYYFCALQFDNGTWYVLEMICPAGAYFNTTFSECLLYDETSTPTTIDMSTGTGATSEETSEIPGSSPGPSSMAPGTSPPTPIVSSENPGSSPIVTSSSPPVDCGTRGIVRADCPVEGRFPDPTDCSKYYICIMNGGMMFHFNYSCAEGSYYNGEKQFCSPGPCPYTMDPCSTSIMTMPTTQESSSSSTTTSNTTIIPMTTITTTTTTTTTIAPSTSTTTGRPGGYVCPMEGLFPDPFTCKGYYKCVLINGLFYYYTFPCPDGTYYDEASKMCISGTC